MDNDRIIPVTTGPGSQPGEIDGDGLHFMPMPDEMATYSMPDVANTLTDQATRVLEEIQQLLDSYPDNRHAIDLGRLDEQSRQLIDQVLGEGEVSIVIHGKHNIHIQESVLAGVWRIIARDENGKTIHDNVEVNDIPAAVYEYAFDSSDIQASMLQGVPGEGVNNAIPLITEITDHVEQSDSAREPHVINLTLLPQSDADLAYLKACLGEGGVTILSRGYGNCRVSSTATKNVWWVQYFNSQDAIILNTLEITHIPSVVCASGEDIEDSAQRLHEIRQVYA